MFTLTLATDNAAFDDSAEIARILRNVADRIDAREGLGLQRWHIADANGNTVGSFGYSETATEESE